MNISCETMWLIVTTITVITIGLYHAIPVLKDGIKLGLRALITWRSASKNKLIEEHGQTKVIFCTFLIFVAGVHVSHLIALWVGTIAWTLKIWTPYE